MHWTHKENWKKNCQMDLCCFLQSYSSRNYIVTFLRRRQGKNEKKKNKENDLKNSFKLHNIWVRNRTQSEWNNGNFNDVLEVISLSLRSKRCSFFSVTDRVEKHKNTNDHKIIWFSTSQQTTIVTEFKASCFCVFDDSAIIKSPWYMSTCQIKTNCIFEREKKKFKNKIDLNWFLKYSRSRQRIIYFRLFEHNFSDEIKMTTNHK